MVQTRRNWSGSINSYNISKDTNELGGTVELGRRQEYIPLPIFVISIGIQQYGFIFDFSSFNSRYKRIDSVFYKIYDENDSPLLKGVLKGFDKNNIFKYHSDTVYHKRRIYSTASVESNYHFKVHLKNKKELTGNFIVYLTTADDQSMEYIFDARKLYISRREIGSLW